MQSIISGGHITWPLPHRTTNRSLIALLGSILNKYFAVANLRPSNVWLLSIQPAMPTHHPRNMPSEGRLYCGSYPIWLSRIPVPSICARTANRLYAAEFVPQVASTVSSRTSLGRDRLLVATLLKIKKPFVSRTCHNDRLHRCLLRRRKFVAELRGSSSPSPILRG